MSHPTTSASQPADAARAIEPPPETGDVLEVLGIPGSPNRRGVITEVIGTGAHEHYRVRWDEKHESLYFPGTGEGMHVFHKFGAGGRSQ